MPNSGKFLALFRPDLEAGETRVRLLSPLLRRILLVNLLPLALLLAALLYLDQYQNGLLEAEVTTLREQARIFAGALSEAAVREDSPDSPHLVADLARPLLRGLTEPTPNAQARLFSPEGEVLADTRVREGAGGAVTIEPLQRAVDRGRLANLVGQIYDDLMTLMPRTTEVSLLDLGQQPAGTDWSPDVRAELKLNAATPGRLIPPYVRRSDDNRLLVSVSEPVSRNRRTLGVVVLTREAQEVDDGVLAVRVSILALFTLALVLTVMLSWYLSLTIARPILRLAGAAAAMREGGGRTGAVPELLLARHDEVGQLARALSDSAAALWTRMDAIERFAADVAHEIKNPLSSIRSAIETLRRIDAPETQRRLTSIIAEDDGRLDRLITDISAASRVDAELSRAATEPVDLTPILSALAEIDEATRDNDGPRLVLDLGEGKLVVQAVGDRLVQVLRNLLGNAHSFSPPNGRIVLSAQNDGAMIEIAVEDEGPGIPEAKLEHIFDRFYSERPSGEHFGTHSGLGLSISRQIVDALKGKISAENRRDESGRVVGARFVVRLPKAA